MPTLRVELLKSREEDDKKDIIVEKRVVHSSNRINMVAGYPQHATKLKYSFTEPLKQRKEKAGTGKTPSVANKKLSKNEINRSKLQTSYKGQIPQSPSESDSFSIKSSSSSSKSEADSIKKPSPPASLPKPNTASLSTSLGSYLGAQAVEMWDVTHMSPSDLSKAIHEKLNGERTLQDFFLKLKFSQGNMVDSHLRRKNEIKTTRCGNAEHLRGGCVLKHDSTNVEVLNEDWAHGLETPAFYSATARSPETSSEISYHSGDTCNAPSIGQQIKHTQSIKELMGQHQGSHKETGGVHEQSHMETHDHMHECMGDSTAQISQVTQEDLSNDNCPYEADIDIDRVHSKAEIISNPTHSEKGSSCPSALSGHVSQRKNDDGFSFESTPICEGTYMQDMPSCRRTSVDRSTYPEVVTDYSKEASGRVSLEKYMFSTPLMGRSVSSAHSRSERGKTSSSPGSLGHAHDGMKDVTRAEVGALTPPPVHEIRFVANSEEFTPVTPVSPLSLGEAGNYQRFDEYNGKEYVDMAWFTTSKAQVPIHTPSRAQWDWRSRSLGARASLKSAVRNLEAAFGGSRSVSLPKTRSQTQQREKKPESSKFIDRVFVSPAKSRHKHAEILRAIQRPSYSEGHFIQDSMRSRRDLHKDDSGREWVGSSHPMSLRKQYQKSEISDFKVSSVPFPPTSRSVHNHLTPLRRLSGHTTPLVSTQPASSMSQPNPSTCMQQGYLQCIVRDGFVCYTLSLKDSEEMLLAKACAFGHDSSKEGCKWMYTFHSGKSKSRGKGANGWRSWLKKDSKSTTDLIGKMPVSSQLCSEVSPTGKRTQSLVSEFVLHDERNDDVVRSQSLRFLSSSYTCHSTFTPAESPSSVRSAYEFVQPSVLHRKQVPDIPKSPSSARVSLKSVNSNLAPPYSPLKGTATHQSSYSIDVWSDSDVAEREVRRLGSYSSLHSELAAIVIKMPTDDHHTITGACRRSLKFSDDVSKGHQGDPQERFVQGVKSDRMTGYVENRATSECVTMMLPKEHHGLPKGGVHGPTSLIERWKCGGKCDCGGWDLGCGMKIFSTQKCEELLTTSHHGNSIQSISHNQPLIIYSQGKTREALLNLSLVQEGYFIVKFKNELSPLKAFATSVAILHSRESSLTRGRGEHTENSISQQYQSSSDIVDPVSKANERPAFLEVCKEIPTWCPSNHPVSPYGRV